MNRSELRSECLAQAKADVPSYSNMTRRVRRAVIKARAKITFRREREKQFPEAYGIVQYPDSLIASITDTKM
jgi:hypothetical protein